MVVMLSNVVFSYSNKPSEAVLRVPSWSVQAGELAFIHGPSGGGKSTLLNLICGLLKPTEGEVSVLGERLDQMSNRKRDQFRANHIGVVFQQFNLIPYLSAVDNILLASHFSSTGRPSEGLACITSLLSSLNISDAVSNCPTRELSIGQQQRVAIARALINQPELLIADEPTSSLDQANRDSFMELLIDHVKSSGKTLLFVSHDLSLSRHFTRVESLSNINQQKEAA